MNKVKKFLAIIENLIFMIFCMIVILFLVQLFCLKFHQILWDLHLKMEIEYWLIK